MYSNELFIAMLLLTNLLPFCFKSPVRKRRYRRLSISSPSSESSSDSSVNSSRIKRKFKSRSRSPRSRRPQSRSSKQHGRSTDRKYNDRSHGDGRRSAILPLPPSERGSFVDMGRQGERPRRDERVNPHYGFGPPAVTIIRGKSPEHKRTHSSKSAESKPRAVKSDKFNIKIANAEKNITKSVALELHTIFGGKTEPIFDNGKLLLIILSMFILNCSELLAC